MAPRSIWNGTIEFGLVRVPVKLFSAIEPKGIAFREVHTKDNSPLKHRLVCRSEGKTVERSEVVKGYEVGADEYILLEPEEIKAAAGERSKTICVKEFVETEAIDPFFFAKTYFLGIREHEEPYAVFAEALNRSGKAGIGRFTFHNREYLVAVRARGDRLFMHTLRFSDEIVSPEDLDIPEGKEPTRKEVDLARRLVSGLTEEFEPGEYEDEYRESVMELIERKAAGRKAPRKKRKKKKESGDLTKALEESLAATGGAN
jgi:DNA end-binding protein Ku